MLGKSTLINKRGLGRLILNVGLLRKQKEGEEIPACRQGAPARPLTCSLAAACPELLTASLSSARSTLCHIPLPGSLLRPSQPPPPPAAPTGVWSSPAPAGRRPPSGTWAQPLCDPAIAGLPLSPSGKAASWGLWRRSVYQAKSLTMFLAAPTQCRHDTPGGSQTVCPAGHMEAACTVIFPSRYKAPMEARQFRFPVSGSLVIIPFKTSSGPGGEGPPPGVRRGLPLCSTATLGDWVPGVTRQRQPRATRWLGCFVLDLPVSPTRGRGQNGLDRPGMKGLPHFEADNASEESPAPL